MSELTKLKVKDNLSPELMFSGTRVECDSLLKDNKSVFFEPAIS